MTKDGCRCKELGDAFVLGIPDGCDPMTTVLMVWGEEEAKFRAGPLFFPSLHSVEQELVMQACDWMLKKYGTTPLTGKPVWSIPEEQWT